MAVEDYRSLFEAAGREWNIDPRVLMAVAQQESGGNPGAVSKAGARGLMQIMAGTGRDLGVTDLHNPAQSIFGGAKYLSQMAQRYQRPELALAAFNAGPGRVDGFLAGRQRLPDETMAYLPAVAGHYQKIAEAAPAPSPAGQAKAAADAPAFDENALADIEREAVGLPPRAGAKPAFQIEPQSDIERQAIGLPREGEAPGKPGEIDPLTGQPFQFAGTAPDTPLTRSLGKPVMPGHEAGPVTTAIGSLATDPEQRRRIVSSQLFPNLQPGEAQSRVFYGPDGRLAAVDEKGNPYYVDPESPRISLSSPRLGNPLSYAASGAGQALPIMGGAAGGAIAGPGSVVAGPALSAAGAAGGDIARQYLARQFDPSATPQPIDLGQTAREAALSGGGQLAGGLISNVLAPNPLRVSPGEVRTMRVAPVMQDTRDAYARAAGQGVDLTPGQATGLPSLLQYEDASTTMPQTVDQATGFYRNQGNQLQAAGQNMLSTISPNADKTDAALAFREGAQDAARSVRTRANAAARPLYQQAETAGNVMSPDLAQLADVPVVKQAMSRAGKTYQNLYRTKPPGTPDFALWDLTKRQLDDAYTVASRAGERTDAMAIDKARQDLLTHLESAYPTYAQARAVAAPGQRLASTLEDSGVGSTMDTAGTERARAIVAPVFNQNPKAIAQARDAFAQAGRSDEWNAGVRAYIQDAFDRASMSQQGLNPSMLRRQVWGNIDNREAIQAALTPQQYRGFDNFMKTVEDISRTYPMNSLTATRGNARGALESAAAQSGGVRTIDAAMTASSVSRLAHLGEVLFGGTRQRMVQANMRRIVDHLFSPDGLQYLEAMSAYSPGSMRAIEATAQTVSRTVPRLLAAPETATDSNPLAAPPAGQ